LDKFTHSNKTYNTSFANSYDIITGHKEYDKEVSKFKSILDLYGIDKNAKLIDVGCGTGNHSVLLAEYGYDIKAVDLSPDMINIANDKGSKVSFEAGNIITLAIDKYKGAYSLFNVVNCIPDPNILRNFFQAVYNNLEECGLYVFECWNPIAVLQDHPKEVSRSYDHDGYHIERTVSPSWDFMKQHLRLVYDVIVKNEDGSTYEDFKVDMDLKLYTPLELNYLLESVGFKEVKVKTALPDYLDADENSRMLIITCLK
jgi:SAM-dependent methyltransferase